MASHTTDIVAKTAVIIIIALMCTPFFLAIKLYMTGTILGEDENSKYWRWGFYFNKKDKKLFCTQKIWVWMDIKLC